MLLTFRTEMLLGSPGPDPEQVELYANQMTDFLLAAYPTVDNG